MRCAALLLFATLRQISAPPPPLEARVDTHNDLLPWQAAVNQGKEAIAWLERDVKTIKQSQWTNSADLQKYGWSQPQKSPLVTTSSLGGSYARMWKDFRFNDDIREVYNVHSGNEEWTGTGGYYRNMFSSDVIIADKNYSPDEKNRGKHESQKLPREKVTPLKHFSDVLFLQFVEAQGGKLENLKSLRAIVRKQILTGSTLAVALEALGRQSSAKTIQQCDWPHRAIFEHSISATTSTTPITTTNVGEEAFYALLGTKHGRGVARFLAQHKEQLGWKTVKQISIFNTGEVSKGTVNLLFKLAPYKPPPPLEARVDGLIQPPLTWADAVKRGEEAYKWLGDDISKVPQSKYTGAGDLEEYGWSKPKKLLIEDLSKGIAEAYEVLLQDMKFSGKVTEISSYQIGNKAWPKTTGAYRNAFSRDLIVAETNFSPDTSNKKLPASEQVPADRITPLKHLADVLYLQFLASADNNATKLKSLKAIARSRIVTTETQDLIKEALKETHATDITKCDWHHRAIFPARTESFHALLGTKHGRGVARFLSQHKEQLGWKTVTKVSVFNGGGGNPVTLHLLFELADVDGKKPHDLMQKPPPPGKPGVGETHGTQMPEWKREMALQRVDSAVDVGARDGRAEAELGY